MRMMKAVERGKGKGGGGYGEISGMRNGDVACHDGKIENERRGV